MAAPINNILTNQTMWKAPATTTGAKEVVTQGQVQGPSDGVSLNQPGNQLLNLLGLFGADQNQGAVITVGETLAGDTSGVEVKDGTSTT